MSVNIEILADYIIIADEKGEIVYWDRQEWLEDPDVIVPITNAIHIAHTEGAEALRAWLKKG